MLTRDPAFIIKIAADSVQQLRRSDVERVFDTCSEDELPPTAERPDLAAKVEQELAFQREERHPPV